MKTFELKSGEHFVKLRDGSIYMVIGKNIVNITEFTELDNYNEDMTHKIFQELDIVKVYKTTESPINLDEICRYFEEQAKMIDSGKLDIVWERKEKIELTDVERVILENIDEKYQWIARDKDGGFLCVFNNKPTKHEDKYWYFDDDTNCNFVSIEVFQHIFQSIQWEDDEPQYIPDLLKNIVTD